MPFGCGSFVLNKMKNANAKPYTGRLHEEDEEPAAGQPEEKAEAIPEEVHPQE